MTYPLFSHILPTHEHSLSSPRKALPSVLASAFRSTPTLYLWSLALGLLVTLLPYLLYSAALRRMETGRASLLSSIEPVVATLAGLLLYREPLTLPITLGILLVLGALALLSRH